MLAVTTGAAQERRSTDVTIENTSSSSQNTTNQIFTIFNNTYSRD